MNGWMVYPWIKVENIILIENKEGEIEETKSS